MSHSGVRRKDPSTVSRLAASGRFFHVTGVELPQEKHTIAAKSCVQSCKSLVPIQARASVKDVYVYVHCCTSDLCNGAGTQGPGATAMGLVLVASVLVTLSGASL